MSKYLSEDVIKNKLEQINNDIEFTSKKLKTSIDERMFGVAKIEIDIISQNKIRAVLLNDLLMECEELETTDLNIKNEIQKSKQCKDCEEFVCSEMQQTLCPFCSVEADNVRDCEVKWNDCPQVGFCKKHEKFVDEYTECLDEEE